MTAAPAPRPSLTGGFSIKAKPMPAAPKVQTVVEVKPLTQDDLEAYWQAAGTELQLEELLKAAAPRLGGRVGMIEIDALTVGFRDEFMPHRIDVMQVLRAKSGMPMLECKVNPMFVTKEELIYNPDNKYKTMLEANPAMRSLRSIFPEIDY